MLRAPALRSLLLATLRSTRPPPAVAMPPKKRAASKAKAKKYDSDEERHTSSSGSDVEYKPAKKYVKKSPEEKAAAAEAKAKAKAEKAAAAAASAPVIPEGWISMHTRGVPFVMYKCETGFGFLFFFFFPLARRQAADALRAPLLSRPRFRTHKPSSSQALRHARLLRQGRRL
jgi:hypothetical protein